MNALIKLHKEQMEEFDKEYQMPMGDLPQGWCNNIKSFITSHNLKQIDAIIEWAKRDNTHPRCECYSEGMADLLSFLEEYKQQIKI